MAHLELPADLRQALASAVAAHGSPAYVYNLELVAQRCGELADAVGATRLGGAEAPPGGPDAPAFALLYALKANACPAVVRTILSCPGFSGLDCVSVGEVHLALALAAPRVLFTNCNVPRGELREVAALAAAHPGRIWVNVDSLDTLGAAPLGPPPCPPGGAPSRCGGWVHPPSCALPPGTEVFLRVNGPVGGGHHAHVITCGPRSKFGVPWQQLPLALAAADAAGLRVVGLHQHIGSGVRDVATFGAAVDVLLGVARGALGGARGPALPQISSHPLRHLRYLNFGGGVGVPYRPAEAPVDLPALGGMLRAKCGAFAAEWAASGVAVVGGGAEAPPRLTVLLEPGRFPVAESGFLVATATAVKPVPSGRTFLGVDTGFHHLVRPVMYGSYHHISVLPAGGGGGGGGGGDGGGGAGEPPAPSAYHVAGCICESGDVFTREDGGVPGTKHAPPCGAPGGDEGGGEDGDGGEDDEPNAPGPRLLPPAAPGDLLVFHTAGAYGYAMASEYNLRPRPAEVVLRRAAGSGGGWEAALARRRRTVQELVDDALAEGGGGV